jgi:hypothetical protein
VCWIAAILLSNAGRWAMTESQIEETIESMCIEAPACQGELSPLVHSKSA